MAEHEQGAERWGEWQKGWNGAVVRKSLVAEEVQWMTPELANALEADNAALRQQLATAEAKAVRLAQGYLRVLDTMGNHVAIQCKRCKRITRLDEEHLTAEHNDNCIVADALAFSHSDEGKSPRHCKWLKPGELCTLPNVHCRAPDCFVKYDALSRDTGNEEGKG